jgi:hypothetical protein
MEPGRATAARKSQNSSIVVLLSGTVFLLVLLPFMFIQFFYVPWMEAQAAARAPRSLSAKTAGHVILTGLDAVEATLILCWTAPNIRMWCWWRNWPRPCGCMTRDIM